MKVYLMKCMDIIDRHIRQLSSRHGRGIREVELYLPLYSFT
jgi:hypothetical protein